MMMPRYQANPEVSCGDEPDGAVLFNPDSNSTTVINPSGRRLWSFLEQARTIDEIAAFLVESYDGVEIAPATRDATEFIGALTPDFVIEVSDVS